MAPALVALAALVALSVVALSALVPSHAHAQEPDAWRLDLSGPVTYFIAPASPASGAREEDRTMALWALQAWSAEAAVPVRLEPAPEGTAMVRVYWVPAGGGMYGEMRARRIEGKRGADVFVRPDTDALGPDIAPVARRDPLFRDAIVYLTCVHELGHAFGLVHTRDFADIMYSFQWGGDFVQYFMRFRDQLDAWEHIPGADPLSAGDRAQFRALYR